ncbi:hypothetical protein AXF42_Ash009483 [Apostasia shenzhenica]|uniref:Uncharacterized protein n=1 Tax=Apostasia shenzhenica TaxID=1088818 RepID=A0A2I0B8Z7_9ASPA|nr:hypothetical protein AXF42_Ash009483 [Apostasia shenzhenica]
MTPTTSPLVFIQVAEVRVAFGHAHQCTSRLPGGHVISGSVPPHPERTRGADVTSHGADITSAHVEQWRYKVNSKHRKTMPKRSYRIDRG